MNHQYYPQYYSGQETQAKATLLSTTNSHLDNIDFKMITSSHLLGMTGIVHDCSKCLSNKQVDIYSQNFDSKSGDTILIY